MITQYQCPKTGRTCEVTGCTGCWTTERQWVDLTDDEIDMVLALVGSDASFHTKYHAVIAAFKEKNK